MDDLSQEHMRKDCFLCNPHPALLVHGNVRFQSIAGLGPIVDGYMVVSRREHLTLSEVLVGDLTDYFAYVESIRKYLMQKYGQCTLTEHGKLPLCFLDQDPTQHCFHPHFLLLPETPDVYEDAAKHFQKHRVFDSLSNAIQFGLSKPNYLLISDKIDVFKVYWGTIGLPRQIARSLVADRLQIGPLADWRRYPNTAKALSIAQTHRSPLTGELIGD